MILAALVSGVCRIFDDARKRAAATRRLLVAVAALAAFCAAVASAASMDPTQGDYRLGPGDAIHIQVFQNPDLSLDTRVSEGGTITYPLVGKIQLGGDTIAAAEQKIAEALNSGGFIQKPQVNIVVLQIRGNQVSVLGQVNRPGRYPIEIFNSRISEMLAIAGGISSTGADRAIIVGTREGKPFRKEIDIPGLFLDNKLDDDVSVAGGDLVYVHRAPVFYIYGEAQRPGAYRVEREMTIQQALAQGGGTTLRGSEGRLRLHRRDKGVVVQSTPNLSDPIHADDVLYVGERIF